MSIYTSVRNIGLGIVTKVLRNLPLWKTAAHVNVLPPLRSLPVRLPVNHAELPASFASKFIAKKSIPVRRIFTLRNVNVTGQAVVFNNLRVFVPSLTWLRDLDLFRQSELLIRQWKKPSATISGGHTALVFDDWSAANYYHWMIEALPRLVIARLAFPGCKIFVPESSPPYIKTTLELLGITDIQPISRYRYTVVKVESLILPELVYYEEDEKKITANHLKDYSAKTSDQLFANIAFNPEEELIVFVRKLLLRNFDVPATPSRRVYISRSAQATRKLINEKDVLPILRANEFEVCYFEGMNFHEQVQLMLNTAVFISVHGSNMVNILFMQSGSTVIELMNKEYVNDAYYLLASSIQLPYYSLPCDMPGASADKDQDRVLLNDSDLVVNPEELKRSIAWAITG